MRQAANITNPEESLMMSSFSTKELTANADAPVLSLLEPDVENNREEESKISAV